MAERKRIALNYRTGYDFAAGIVIYIQNVIKGLKLLDDSLRPHLIIIYSDSSSIEELKKIDYPYLSYYKFKPVRSSLFVRGLNKFSRKFFNSNFIKRYSFPTDADILYPHFENEETFYYKDRLYWKPDFQEMYYPNYFSQAELNYSYNFMKRIAANPAYTLVLSSGDAFNDFKKFFSPYKINVKILRFTSILPDLSGKNAEAILKKYNIRKKYFLIANQFWPHKNHMLVLEALRQVVQQHDDFVIVMTGKQSTYRDKKYFVTLEKFILQNNLKGHVKMTGFISREDQLVLMKNAMAIIQPSLFEGWSTVIEDCKALGKYVIASDLDVNKEQLSSNVSFFGRNNSRELAAHMTDVLTDGKKVTPHNYDENIEAFKKDLINVFDLGRR
jgi:glycosyltransferase involved in cell wall biosynthesis